MPYLLVNVHIIIRALIQLHYELSQWSEQVWPFIISKDKCWDLYDQYKSIVYNMIYLVCELKT